MASVVRSPIIRANLKSTVKQADFLNTWRGRFDSQLYLKTRYPSPGTVRNHFALFLLKCIHQFQAKLTSSRIRVLEYGCGPVPIHTASFASKASEIILAEYLESNRKEVKKWLTRDKSGFHWTPYIEHVVRTLERQESEDSVYMREEQMRAVIKDVVPCNIQNEPPLQLESRSGFDVVLSVFCIEAGTSTKEEYLDAVRKLSCLVEPGGNLLLFSGKWIGNGHQGYYTVGENTFYNVTVSTQLVMQALKECGGKEVAIEEMDADPDDYRNIQTDMKGFIFASAKFS